MEKHTRLARIGITQRDKQANNYDKSEDYNEIFRELEGYTKLKVKSDEAREIQYPKDGYDLDKELEMPYIDKGYDLSKDENAKGDPFDGGHTHSIPQEVPTTLISPQLDTYTDRGNPKDREMRHRLTAINKYGQNYNYNVVAMDDEEMKIDGQYMVEVKNWPQDPMRFREKENKIDVSGKKRVK